ncbi:MAG: hypothetical protein U5S82_23490 [Gammaproteobacteria bacterium]|nr:hypothetical protein [Gammaproteobacteria bacterium]MDZ7752558.1 hypothetical protein [Gammaproteobacteria bacterium]MDZ7752629.1 hypothetical protein [Gammaproteobacteria bacterium]MDZ7753192.1 hypothetical protein [Gammaproteobacteria bacterium]MDZ7753304.1 hypothetical protein [Gammaproteobacteria bacterium]
MRHHTTMNDDDQTLPDHLSDEAAAQMVDLLYAIAQTLENRYFAEITRYYQNTNPRQPDLWD